MAGKPSTRMWAVGLTGMKHVGLLAVTSLAVDLFMMLSSLAHASWRVPRGM